MATPKTALVTGANKGIGHEVARRLAMMGYKIWLGARDVGRGAASADQLRSEGHNVRPLALDVTDDESVRAAAEIVVEEDASLDVLVNNAGIAINYELCPSQQQINDVKATYDVNVFGPIRVTQAFLPLLIAAPSARIVMVSSYAASISRALDPLSPSHAINMMSYGSSKTALNAITVAFAKELMASGIKVNAAAPGYTATDLNGRRGHRTVQQAADIIVKLATIEANGPTGGYFDENGSVAW